MNLLQSGSLQSPLRNSLQSGSPQSPLMNPLQSGNPTNPLQTSLQSSPLGFVGSLLSSFLFGSLLQSLPGRRSPFWLLLRWQLLLRSFPSWWRPLLNSLSVLLRSRRPSMNTLNVPSRLWRPSVSSLLALLWP